MVAVIGLQVALSGLTPPEKRLWQKLRPDTIAAESLLRSWGYWQAAPQGGQAGPRFHLRSLSIAGDSTAQALIPPRLLKRWQGRPLTPALLQEVPVALRQMLANQGYLYAGAAWHHFFCDSAGRCTAQLHLTSGPLVRLDTIFLRGPWPASRGAFYQITGLRPGRPISLQALQMLPHRLRSTPYATLVDTPKLWLFPGLAWLEIQLQPKNANRLDGSLSLLPTGSGLSTRPQLIGQFDLVLVSPFRLGEQLEAHFSQLPNRSQRLQVRLGLPYLWLGLLALQGKFMLWRQDTSFLSREVGFSVRYRLSPAWTLLAEGQRTTSRLLSTAPYRALVWPPPRVLDFDRQGLTLGWEFQNTDLRTAPRQGWILTLTGTQGRRGYRQNPGLPAFQYDRLPPPSPYREVEASLERYTPITALLTLRTGLRLYRYWARGYVENELRRLGGEALRGFPENTLPTAAYVQGLLELRLHLEEEGYLAAFAEVARLDLYLLGNQTTQAAGLALQTRLSAGLFRLTFAAARLTGNPWDLRRLLVSLTWVSEF